MASIVDFYDYLLELQEELLDFISEINEMADTYEDEMDDAMHSGESELGNLTDMYANIKRSFENETNSLDSKQEIDAICQLILNPKNVKNYPVSLQGLVGQIGYKFILEFWEKQDPDNNPFVAYSEAIDKWIVLLEEEIRDFGKRQMGKR